MNPYVFICAYMIAEMLCLIMIYGLLFDVSLRHRAVPVVVTVVCLLAFHCVACWKFGEYNSTGVAVVTLLCIPLFMLDGSKLRNLLTYPFAAIASSVLSVGMSFLMAVIFSVSESHIENAPWTDLMCEYFAVLFLLAATLLAKRRRIADLRMQVSWKQILLLTLAGFCVLFELGPLQSLSEDAGVSQKLINWIGLAATVGSVMLVGITIWQGMALRREALLREKNAASESYIRHQKEHYDTLLAQDQRMRKFRHDMREHFSIVKLYCQDGEYDKIPEYIDKCMNVSGLNYSGELIGIRSVDVLLQDLLARARDAGISCEVHGRLRNFAKIEDFDLCTIFNNTVKNAVEACEQIQPPAEKKIEIYVGEYNSTMLIIVKNTTAHPVAIDGNRLATTKEDARIHGLGSQNVADAVARYEGSLTYSYDEPWFTVEICM